MTPGVLVLVHECRGLSVPCVLHGLVALALGLCRVLVLGGFVLVVSGHRLGCGVTFLFLLGLSFPLYSLCWHRRHSRPREKEEEKGHRVVRGQWAPPPTEGKGPREGQRMAIGQKVPPAADENSTPWRHAKPLHPGGSGGQAACRRPEAGRIPTIPRPTERAKQLLTADLGLHLPSPPTANAPPPPVYDYAQHPGTLAPRRQP